jgi:hypothetical protein
MTGRIALAASLLLLGACADSPVLDLLGGGAGLPGPDEPPGQIRRATGDADAGWPNLASVPPRPSGVRTPAQRQALIDSLALERAQTRAAGAALDARTVPLPPVPAIPALSGDVPPVAEDLPVPEAPPAR